MLSSKEESIDESSESEVDDATVNPLWSHSK